MWLGDVTICEQVHDTGTHLCAYVTLQSLLLGLQLVHLLLQLPLCIKGCLLSLLCITACSHPLHAYIEEEHERSRLAVHPSPL